VSHEVLGLIPARAGSKGVPRKNVRPLAGKPLIGYTLEAALLAGSLSRVLVSTDDDEVADLATATGVEVLRRDPAFAQDDTPMVAVIQHVLDQLRTNAGYDPEITVLLQPTAPLRTAAHIEGALELMGRTGAKSVVSVAVVPAHHHPDWQFLLSPQGELIPFGGGDLQDLITRRQSLDTTFTRNGAVYCFDTRSFHESASLYPRPCFGYRMPPEASVNLDSEMDFQLAEVLLGLREEHEQT
jgi:CMP-N-acetylneuraminic acid synthetase